MARARRQVIWDDTENRLPWFIRKEPLLICGPRPSTGMYATLGVANDATSNELKTAWRRRAEQLHPDKNNGVESQDYVLCKNAYKFLSDPPTRRFYDKHQQIPPDYIFLEKQTLNLFEQVTTQMLENAQGESFDFLMQTRSLFVTEKQKVTAQIQNVEMQVKDKLSQQNNLLRHWRGEERLKHVFLARVQAIITGAKNSLFDLEVRLKVINYAIDKLEDTSYTPPSRR